MNWWSFWIGKSIVGLGIVSEAAPMMLYEVSICKTKIATSNFSVNWAAIWLLLGASQAENLVVENLSANARDIKDESSIPGYRGSPGGGHGNPLQYSCLENPMDSGAWQAMVHRVTMILKQLSTQSGWLVLRLTHPSNYIILSMHFYIRKMIFD